MYINKESGLEVYESCEELIKKGITSIYEYDGKYYIRVKLDDKYDSRVWVVDKKTKKLESNIYILDFFLFMDDATEVDENVLKN